MGLRVVQVVIQRSKRFLPVFFRGVGRWGVRECSVACLGGLRPYPLSPIPLHHGAFPDTDGAPYSDIRWKAYWVVF